MFGKINKYLVLKADFNCKLIFGKINKYLVLKADFNYKLMFCKINFILPNIYFTKLYSTIKTSSSKNYERN